VLFGFTPSRCRSGGITANKMKHETLFTFGDSHQYELIETTCVACNGGLMFINEPDTLTLPICLVCEQAMKACERDLDSNEEE